MVLRTVSRSSVELTARPTSLSAFSSSTERASSPVRDWSSVSRRTFSIAMTAWSAKVVASSICLSVKGLVRLQIDVFVVHGLLNAIQAARNASGTIPIVFVANPDPVGTGVVASLARPGENVCGPAERSGSEGPNRAG